MSDEEHAAAAELTRVTEELGLYDQVQGRKLAVDADGYVWWVNSDDTWSMVRTNPDNSPIPHPVTYYEPQGYKQ